MANYIKFKNSSLFYDFNNNTSCEPRPDQSITLNIIASRLRGKKYRYVD